MENLVFNYGEVSKVEASRFSRETKNKDKPFKIQKSHRFLIYI